MSDVSFEVNGVIVQPDVSTAAWFPQIRTLAVADLHFEKGSSFVRRGLHLPPYDTKTTLKRLRAVFEKYQPERVVALGDSFHDGEGPARLDTSDVEALRSMTGACSWVWIYGNHDPVTTQGIEQLGGEAHEELVVERLTFRHEPRGETGEIAGHLHPGAALRQRGRHLRKRCFATNGRSLVLPAFGAYTGSLNVCNGAFQEIFPGGLTAYLVGQEGIYPIAEDRLLPDRDDQWREALRVPGLSRTTKI